MLHEDAANLIKPALLHTTGKQNWADLGCGTGTFTVALASCLDRRSRIYAVDLRKPEIMYQGIEIDCMAADFTHPAFELHGLDGILMANSLHYVADRVTFLEKIKTFFTADPRFIIIEYDTDIANPWVPYPLSLKSARRLFDVIGCAEISLLGRYASVYGPEMYAIEVRFA